MASELKGFQRNYLRGLAHHLKPIVFVGHKGATNEVVKALQEALAQHELIKIKFIENKSKADKQSALNILLEAAGAQFVGMVGHIATLFKPNDDPEKQQICLPTRPTEADSTKEDP
ncbi:MAG: ribosome assembly RNA-binding protein YhbY [Desulfobacteraceae bacterium]|nr:ribosome assembly RNA-binding protein YhbY [Desulfobacteraceae bacterium]